MKDGFESDAGWTLEGEWEIAGPQGLGTSPGDPGGAYAGTGVLGHDLSGQGNLPGDYEPLTTEYATSPVIDASGLSNGELKLRRWLNTGPGAISTIEAKSGSGWTQIWDSNSIGFTSSGWALQTLDVSAHADGNASFQVRFKQFAGLNPASADAGWNVDRFIVRDGSFPEFDSCGDCGGAPTFAGISSAADADGCGDTGVDLAWEAAPGWGSGGTGTYAVYRDTVPGFSPSGANLVASGLAGTTWTDTGAPNDVTLYYLVRAENDETCSSGPNNGGLVDGNLVYASAVDEATQPFPGDLADTLRATDVNDAHVRLSWTDTGTAAAYNVYRSDLPETGFGLLTTVAAPFAEDTDELELAVNRFYLVRAADSCGNEGP